MLLPFRLTVQLSLLMTVSHGYARLTRRIVVDDGVLLLCLLELNPRVGVF